MEPQEQRDTSARQVAKRAYRLFVDELRRIISEARGKLNGECAVNLTPELSEQLRIEFHKLKGGAGFFGLHGVADTAGRLQATFVKQSVALAAEQVAQAAALLRDLEKQSRDIPAPEPDPVSSHTTERNKPLE